METQRDETTTTLGRIYKITNEQLTDIRKQEGSGEMWYGNKQQMGTVDGLPVYTLTRESQYDGYGRSRPAEAYLKVIAKGLAEVHPGVNAGEYLMKAVGHA